MPTDRHTRMQRHRRQLANRRFGVRGAISVQIPHASVPSTLPSYTLSSLSLHLLHRLLQWTAPEATGM